MAEYLLDTSIATDLFATNRPPHPDLLRRFAALGEADRILVSAVTLCELEYGRAKLSIPAELRAAIAGQIQLLLDACAVKDAEGKAVSDGVVPVSASVAADFGAAKAWLVSQRGLSQESAKKHVADILIAACAAGAGAVLVSGDALHQELAKDPGSPLSGRLAVESWLP